MLLKLELDDDDDAITCALPRGMGTREDENGVAPLEYGTLGLLVLFNAEPLPWNEAMNDPDKKMLDADALVVMERTSAAAPLKPPNGAADHDFAFVSQTATAEPGDVNLPPTHTFPSFPSQYTAFISPFGPLLPSAANVLEELVYDAILLAAVPSIEVNEPAK